MENSFVFVFVYVKSASRNHRSRGSYKLKSITTKDTVNIMKKYEYVTKEGVEVLNNKPLLCYINTPVT